MQDALLGIEAIDRKSAPSSDQRTEIKNKEKLSLLSKSIHLVLLKVLEFCRKFQKKDKKNTYMKQDLKGFQSHRLRNR